MGNPEEGIEKMQRGLKGFMAAGAKLWCPYFLGLLASQLGKAGRMEEGMNRIEEALKLAYETGELYAVSELKRIRTELVRLHKKPREALAFVAMLK